MSRADDELFYSVLPQHVLDQHRYGDQLGADIAATRGKVMWMRAALRRAVKMMRVDRNKYRARYNTTHAEYRAAQAELRTLMDARWHHRLTELRAAE